MIETINPATGKRIKTYATMTDTQALNAIKAAHTAFLAHQHESIDDRAKMILSLAENLENKKQALSAQITLEMGKPEKLATAEIDKSIRTCQHYATHTASYLAPREIETENLKSYVSYQPLGVIFSIMPWNYPIWQVMRFTIPALMAGNTVILKHAQNVSGCGLMLADCVPNNGLTPLLISHEQTSDVIAHPNIQAVTLTGSAAAGKIIGKRAAGHLKKVVLELGGSDPYIVCHDADVDKAVDAIVFSRMNNAGQVCVAAKRIIADASIAGVLEEKLLSAIKDYPLGPIAREDLRTDVHQQVLTSIAQGAKCLTGGEIPKGPGFYYPPTLLTQVKPGMCAFDEEIFGPVISISTTENEAEAIALANNTSYGLGGAVFSKDLERAETIARDKLLAGSVAINTFVASDPRLPFGGIKSSGWGRELSAEGIREFTNIKTVVVKG